MRLRSHFCYVKGQNRLYYDDFFDIRTIHKEPIYRAFLSIWFKWQRTVDWSTFSSCAFSRVDPLQLSVVNGCRLRLRSSFILNPDPCSSPTLFVTKFLKLSVRL